MTRGAAVLLLAGVLAVPAARAHAQAPDAPRVYTRSGPAQGGSFRYSDVQRRLYERQALDAGIAERRAPAAAEPQSAAGTAPDAEPASPDNEADVPVEERPGGFLADIFDVDAPDPLAVPSKEESATEPASPEEPDALSEPLPAVPPEPEGFVENTYYYRGRYYRGYVYYAVPCAPEVVVNAGVTYYRCGEVWYGRAYYGGRVVYVLVTPPG